MRNQMLQGVSLEEECKQDSLSRTLLRESQRSTGQGSDAPTLDHATQLVTISAQLPQVERLANGLTPGEDALRRFTLWEGGGCIRHWKKDRDKVSLPVSVCQTLGCCPSALGVVCVVQARVEYEWASFARSKRCLCGIASRLVSPVWLEASSRVDRTSFLWTTFTPTQPRSLPSK